MSGPQQRGLPPWMSDIFNKTKRSEIMSSVRNKDTGPERQVRSALFKEGFRYSLRRRDLPGSPDIVLPKYRAAIFVHGCFWHGHDCNRGKRPKTNAKFWNAKIQKNIKRDRTAEADLKGLGWKVFTVWTCRTNEDTQTVLASLKEKRRKLPPKTQSRR